MSGVCVCPDCPGRITVIKHTQPLPPPRPFPLPARDLGRLYGDIYNELPLGVKDKSWIALELTRGLFIR